MRARWKAWGWVAIALLSIGTLTAQISIPNTFTANTRIVSADVNENFTELGSKALNREGGAMTGDLAVENITFGAHNTYDIGTTGTRARDGWFGRNVGVTGTLTVGTVSATTLTGAGAGITGVAEANITDGAVLARVAGNETISGNWSHTGTTTVGTMSHAIYSALPTGSSHNLDIGSTSMLIYNEVVGTATITGITGGVDGRVVWVIKPARAANLTLSNESASSTAANRITPIEGASLTINGTTVLGAMLVYDAAVSRWVAIPFKS